VDDIDPQGKVSLSLASAPESAAGGDRGETRGARGNGDSAPASASGGGASAPSFEDTFEAELKADLGDLGPGAAAAEGGRGDDRGGDRDRDRNRSRGRSRRR
jgi:hypothetical protein